MILRRDGRPMLFVPTEQPLCVIKRGEYYLTERPQRWTLVREHAAAFASRAVAQTFLQDFPEDFAGATIELYQYVQGEA